MTKDEALKMALEALENHSGNYKLSKNEGIHYNKAITALRQAIEQPDMGIDRGAWSDVPDATKWVDELRGDEDLDAPPNSTTDVVEPVAWMYVNKDGECEQIEFGDPFNDPSVTLLYTAPPKRKWVGLTDEEIVKASIGHVEGEHMLPHSFAREIEKLLREKNHD